MNGSVDFNRKWLTYKEGFGQADGDYWLGKKNKRCILNSQFHWGIFIVPRYLFVKYIGTGIQFILILNQSNDTRIDISYFVLFNLVYYHYELKDLNFY